MFGCDGWAFIDIYEEEHYDNHYTIHGKRSGAVAHVPALMTGGVFKNT